MDITYFKSKAPVSVSRQTGETAVALYIMIISRARFGEGNGLLILYHGLILPHTYTIVRGNLDWYEHVFVYQMFT